MKLINAIAFLNCYCVQWHRTHMKHTQAQKSGILEQGPLPWHQEEMSKQLLNYSLQEKRKEKNPTKRRKKTLYKRWSYFKEKSLRGCKKRVTQSARLINLFAKKLSSSSLLVPLSLQRSRFLRHNCLACPPKTSPITFKLYWQRLKKRKRRQKIKAGFHSKHQG